MSSTDYYQEMKSIIHDILTLCKVLLKDEPVTLDAFSDPIKRSEKQSLVITVNQNAVHHTHQSMEQQLTHLLLLLLLTGSIVLGVSIMVQFNLSISLILAWAVYTFVICYAISNANAQKQSAGDILNYVMSIMVSFFILNFLKALFDPYSEY